VLLDNYYCSGVNSADGHQWATQGIVTDYQIKQSGENTIGVVDRVKNRYEQIKGTLPPGVEVVSIGREKTYGPPVIVRLGAGYDGDSGAVMFVAKKVEGVATPRPFTPATEIAASGWSVEPLRERSFDPKEMNQLSEWARRYATGE